MVDSNDDSNNRIYWNILIIVGFIGVGGSILGAYIGGSMVTSNEQKMYYEQLHDEQKNIAKAIEIDINGLNNSITFYPYYTLYKTKSMKSVINAEILKNRAISLNANNFNISSDFDLNTDHYAIVLESSLYNNKTCLYFVFDHDISSLDYNLSSEIYQFYNDLFYAETDRTYVWQHDINISDPTNKTWVKYEEMQSLIVKCGDNVSKIENDLSKV
jgi:hypothetical protein